MSKVAFLFPGQGAQKLGMAVEVCQTVPAAQDLFDRASSILGYDLLDLCANGPEEKLNSTAVSQPALYVAGLAAIEKLRAQDSAVVDSCAAAAGLSLGEYTALVFADAMSFEDGLRVVRTRGEAMQAAADATPSAMASILGMEVPALEAVVAEASSAGYVKLANLLCPKNLVISGTKEAVTQACTLAEAAGALQTIPLTVAGAFHTDIMKPADDKLAAALAEVPIRSPRIPVISNVDAEPHKSPDDIRRTLVAQVLGQVRWEDSMRRLLADGFDRFYELGPGRVLAGLMKRIQRKTDFTNVEV